MKLKVEEVFNILRNCVNIYMFYHQKFKTIETVSTSRGSAHVYIRIEHVLLRGTYNFIWSKKLNVSQKYILYLKLLYFLELIKPCLSDEAQCDQINVVLPETTNLTCGYVLGRH